MATTARKVYWANGTLIPIDGNSHPGAPQSKSKKPTSSVYVTLPKTVLASWFFDAADKFHYFDMGSNDYVFHRFYDMAVDTTDGVNMLFEQSCSCEEMYDTLYQGCLK